MRFHSFSHNYVIVGSAGYSNVGFYDLSLMEGVRYFQNLREGINSKLTRTIQRISFSEKANKFIRSPFSYYTFSHLYPFSFKESKPLVFLFLGQNQTVYQSGYVEYLREKYPDVKVVLYMIDLISRNKKLRFAESRGLFDLILSYDKGDCEKYGLEYYPTPYSNYPVPEDLCIDQFDVYYCGNAKMRGEIIFDAYKELKKHNLRCKFFITDAPLELRIDSDEIVYDQYIDYSKNLQYVKKAKCILEVMQNNADGYTPRLWESIMYDRHLLTNNNSLSESRFFVSSAIHSLNEIDRIQDWIDNPLSIDKTLKDSLSPVHLLHFIDKKLDE